MDRKLLKNFYRFIVSNIGSDGVLYTFDYCTNYGLELDNSTIDEIIVIENDILFYYNANDNDCDSFDHFKTDDLCQFMDGLLKAIEEE